MSRVRTFGVTATSEEEKRRFLDDAYLIRAKYDWPCLSDAVIFAVNRQAHWLRFARYPGDFVIGALEDCAEYTPFSGLTEAVEAYLYADSLDELDDDYADAWRKAGELAFAAVQATAPAVERRKTR